MENIKTIYLKNLICSRCITVVQYEMQHLGVEITYIDLTKMMVRLNGISILKIEEALEKHELGIIKDKDERTVEGIKTLLRELVYTNGRKLNIRVSDLITQKFQQNYSHLSRLFAMHEDITIERYFILLKIERVKEALEQEKPLSEITTMLSYSSPQHLSRQFKTITGISISDYKKYLQVSRICVDKVG